MLPAFLSHKRQRELTEWALCDHAREPNATNLDVHYIVPPEGLWTLAHASDPLIHPRAFALPSTSGPGEASGPRKLISNIPASRNTYTSLVTGPKPDAPPAPDLSPAQASTLLTKLRWANIGWYYHWGTKQYDFLRGPAQVDQGLRTLCKSAVRAVPWAEVFSKHDVGEEWQGETWEDWDAGYGRYESVNVGSGTD